jgi:hypothetical protein
MLDNAMAFAYSSSSFVSLNLTQSLPTFQERVCSFDIANCDIIFHEGVANCDRILDYKEFEGRNHFVLGKPTARKMRSIRRIG